MSATSPRLERVLVPTDYSPIADRALEWAILHGSGFAAKVILLHVLQRGLHLIGYSEGPDRNDVSTDLDRLEKYATERLGGRDVALACVVEIGDPPHKIREVASREDVDLIIIGTHGRTRLEDLIFGSVAAKVIHHTGCPVLVVPPAREAE